MNNYLPEFTNASLELAVIECLIREGVFAYNEIRDELADDSFSNHLHAGCYRALKELFAEGSSKVDRNVFVVQAQKINDCEWPTISEVDAWNSRNIETSNLKNMVLSLNELKIKRVIAGQVASVVDYINTNKRSSVADIQKAVRTLLLDKVSSQSDYMQDAMVTTMNFLEKMKRNERELVLSSGFNSIDALLEQGGFKAGTLNVIGARPGVGKSAILNNIIYNMLIADKEHKLYPMVMFSLEMTKDELIKRFLSRMGKVQSSCFYNGNVSPESWASIVRGIKDAFDHESETPRLILIDKGGLTLDDVKNYIDEIVSRYGGVSVISLDYLQLMPVNTNYQTKASALGEISGALKNMAMQYKSIVFSAVQLNRTADDAKAELKSSMIKDSGSIEQDADFIMLMRKKLIEGAESISERDICITKNRNGTTGAFSMHFYGDSYLFTEEQA